MPARQHFPWSNSSDKIEPHLPCNECKLNPGEICIICGAREPLKVIKTATTETEDIPFPIFVAVFLIAMAFIGGLLFKTAMEILRNVGS